eukprot:Nitzschia sp. Nitz4//scaffold196_size54656//22641//23459//NITZ4_006639-RA/size54656-processed-gene-0.61-mRNA-1//-1//CDS//3329540426//7531//frame0
MAATDIILPFSVKAFNQVNDYFDVRQYGDRDKKLFQMLDTVNAFGDLYCEHGMESTAGLSLSHRHFDLKEGEMKIATQSNDTLLKVKATPIHDIPEAAEVLPYLFQPVLHEGSVRLLPLEYVIHQDPEHIAALKSEIDKICNPDFLKAFCELAEARKVSGLYGIFLQSRDFLRYLPSKEGTIEGSGEGDRVLQVKVVSKKFIRDAPDATTVGWSFRKDGDTGRVIPVSACSAVGHDETEGDEGTWTCSVCPWCSHPTCYPGCRGVHEHKEKE